MLPPNANPQRVTHILALVAAGVLGHEDGAASLGWSEDMLIDALGDPSVRATVDKRLAEIKENGEAAAAKAGNVLDRVIERLKEIINGDEQISAGTTLKIGEFLQSVAGDREQRVRRREQEIKHAEQARHDIKLLHALSDQLLQKTLGKRATVELPPKDGGNDDAK